MSPGWIAVSIAMFAVVAALAIAAASRARASEQPPRQWAIERCHDGACEVLGWRYSGPTACAVDAASERMVRQMPSGVRLACVKEMKR